MGFGVGVPIHTSWVSLSFQVEDTKQEGQEDKEKDEKEEGDNIPEEKEGIEMNDDFDGMKIDPYLYRLPLT